MLQVGSNEAVRPGADDCHVLVRLRSFVENINTIQKANAFGRHFSGSECKCNEIFVV